MEKYTTGTGQHIAVHNKEDCAGEFCVIHNPSNHIMKDWPTHWRDDRLIMERMCKCGVGHPDPDDLAFKKALAIKQYSIRLPEASKCIPMDEFGYDTGVHGCCGCCTGKKLNG
jgi:hypothetical protein